MTKVSSTSPSRAQPPLTLARHRALLTVLANVVVIASAYLLSFLIRFDFTIPPVLRQTVLLTLPVVLTTHYAAFYIFKLTRGWWRYVGIVDFANALKAAVVAGTVFATFVLFTHRHHFPRSIFVLNAILVVGLTIGIRLLVRLWRQLPSQTSGNRKRLLIIGAGDTGEALLREIRHSPQLEYQVVAFVDDNPAKRSAYINGVPVVDEISGIGDVVSRLRIDEIIVATPSASGDEMRRIIAHCRKTGLHFRVMPATWEVLSGRAGLNAAREVDINDLLRRLPVALDLVQIGKFLAGKRVLVSGAAGSIGSEICRQVLSFQPQSLICLDHDENALFFLERALGSHQDARVIYQLADITDKQTIQLLFEQAKPQVVFHAAAHKHVPMIERNPAEGVRNNVFGTEILAHAAARVASEAFVLISTDKAVNPTSVMGTSKRIAELLIQGMQTERTRYMAVRFGNVLGSQGSVVPILQEQIAKGGPVTVTHPDMRRYFMTIPEAVQLVIQAAAMGHGDEVFMLDMGEPVRIVDLAHDLITLSGLRPGVDITIKYVGIRPGEKLTEELYLEAEEARPTAHPKIVAAKRTSVDPGQLKRRLEDLRTAASRNDEPAVRRLLQEIVPEYVPNRDGAPVVPITSARGVGSP